MGPLVLAIANLVNVLGHVEVVAPRATGLLAFGEGGDAGGIFVERGRICWVVARGMQRRLHEILQGYARAHNGDTANFDSVYQRCRASGTLLGQVLVEEGHVTAEELEVSLRRHSAESLVALCGALDLDDDDEAAPPAITWRTRGERGYEPRFTFKPLDVLLDAIAIADPEGHARARRELARVDGPDRAGGAFELGSATPTPIAASGDLGVGELAEIVRAAARLPLAARELGAGVALAFTTARSGDTLVAWWRDDLLYAMRCASRAVLAELLARLRPEEGAR